MKLLIMISLFAMPLVGMDKGSPRKDEKYKTSRDDKQKQTTDKLRDEKPKTSKDIIIRETPQTRLKDRRASDAPERISKSESPQKKDGSPARASTVGKKRGSLDWTDALKSTFIGDSSRNSQAIDSAKKPEKDPTDRHSRIFESIKLWSENDPIEEKLKELHERAQTATPRTRRVLLCEIMNTDTTVSKTKELIASNTFLKNYHVATLALYNIPGFISVKNFEEIHLTAKQFHGALCAARAAYIDKLLSEAPKRERYECEKVANTSSNSPIVQLEKQFTALEKQYPEFKEELMIKMFTIPEFKKP